MKLSRSVVLLCVVKTSQQSKTSTASKQKYNEKAYDRIALTVKKGTKDHLKNHALQQGETLNGFINRAIANQIQTDNENRE